MRQSRSAACRVWPRPWVESLCYQCQWTTGFNGLAETEKENSEWIGRGVAHSCLDRAPKYLAETEKENGTRRRGAHGGVLKRKVGA
jgi:hypothetical protein